MPPTTAAHRRTGTRASVVQPPNESNTSDYLHPYFLQCMLVVRGKRRGCATYGDRHGSRDRTPAIDRRSYPAARSPQDFALRSFGPASAYVGKRAGAEHAITSLSIRVEKHQYASVSFLVTKRSGDSRSLMPWEYPIPGLHRLYAASTRDKMSSCGLLSPLKNG